jgi:methionine biosynthesis protein MetW
VSQDLLDHRPFQDGGDDLQFPAAAVRAVLHVNVEREASAKTRVLGGRMPVTKVLPYQWYDTPNIRVGTLADFEVLAGKTGLVVTDRFGLHDGQVVRHWPNLRASVAVFRFERG